MYFTRDQKVTRLYTGGADGVVNVWGEGLKKLQTINLKHENLFESQNFSVRAICEKNSSCFAIGIRGGEIVEFNNKKINVCVRGHFSGELWGLCVDKTQNVFYTVGEDCLVAKWDISSKKQLQVNNIIFS